MRIEYIDGTEEIVETVADKKDSEHYIYDSREEMFVVFDHTGCIERMRIPREVVKSIGNIEVN